MDPFSGGDSNPIAATQNKFETEIKPIGTPQGKKPKAKQPMATFMGSEATPGPASSNFGGKTLMGM